MYSQQEKPTNKKLVGLGLAVLAAGACVGIAYGSNAEIKSTLLNMDYEAPDQMYHINGRDYKFCPWESVKNNSRGAQNHP